MRRLVTLMLVCATLSAIPAVTFAGTAGLPVVAADSLPSQGWYSYRFTVAATTAMKFEVLGQVANSHEMANGYWLFDDAGRRISSYAFTQYGAGQEVHVGAPVGTVVSQNPGGASGLAGFSVSRDIDPGVYVIVGMVLASGSETTTAALYGDGLALVNKTSGTDTFLDWEPDFQGANVLVGVPLARAQGMVAASTSETTEAPLFGWFASSPNGTQLAGLRWTGPEGTSGQGTSVPAVANPGGFLYGGSPAGTYTFTVDYTAGAYLSAIWAWGAGVTLA